MTGSRPLTRVLNIRNPSKRMVVVWCLVVLALFGAGYLVGVIRSSQPGDGVGAWAPKYTPSPQFSDEYNAFADWVLNDIARMKEPWTPDIANRLAEVLNEAYSEEYIEMVATDPDATLSDQEPLMRHGYVEAIVAERLRRAEPMDPEARRILVISLLDSLRHPYWRIRHGAVNAVCYARLVEDRTIRLLVESMFEDSNPDVAANARKQLAHFDEIESLSAEQAP